MEKNTEKEGMQDTACMEPYGVSGKKGEEDEFRKAREEWTKLEQEEKRIGLASTGEVIDAFKQAMEHMDGYNRLACSYTVMEERFGISHATVWRSIKYLKDHGYIYIYKSGSCNIYTISPELAWRSWGSNMKYCKFPANVMITGSEQKRKVKLKKKRGSVELAEPKEESLREEFPFD